MHTSSYIVAFVLIISLFSMLRHWFRGNRTNLAKQPDPEPANETPLGKAQRLMAKSIESWKDKADVNCDSDTLSHQILQICSVVQVLAAALALQLPARGVTLPTWLSIVLTVGVLVVAGVNQYVTEMVRKHDYPGRWTRIRQALDGMIADQALLTVRGGIFTGLTDEQAADLAVRRLINWIGRARGMAPPAPLPEK